ncbi:hypothetical protein V1514DRAFT_328063 [Lipomyces japonicus]|uniref:uncharacterized protein n=1 Tax=Lipomyces japonicus TaxID=56871 RepID=UPI0034CFBEB9
MSINFSISAPTHLYKFYLASKVEREKLAVMSLVEVIGKESQGGHHHGAGRRKTQTKSLQSNSSTIQRAIQRRLNDLERENYHDTIKIELPRTFAGKTVATRKILTSRKTLTNLFDEDEHGAAAFQSVAAQPSVYPGRHLCSVCGYWGTITCTRCSARYCSLACQDTHRETRCLKVYA